jgi:serine/threonine-protein kinase
MFGPYELRSRLGVGGMGEVYQAYDTVKDRIVALKLLRPEFAADQGFQERFRRESRMAARLHEPHVIPVHDFGEIDHVLFIDMRFVDGGDLGSILRRSGAMPPARAAAIVAQIAAALDAAHAAGLTHRDVKPENVLMTNTDFAYLVDFGIARSGSDSGLTTAGSAIGSRGYMAPERFTGGHVGPSADVYSLTCLLYECLVARPPFPNHDATALMTAHIMAPPPRPSAAVPGLNPAFDGLVAWGMAKDPAARCPTAGDLARAAGAAAVGQPPHGIRPAVETALPQPESPPPTGGSRRGTAIGAAVLGIVALVVIAAVAWFVFGRGGGASAGNATGTMTPATVPPTSTISTTPPSTITTSAPPTPAALPGTDGQGFIAQPGARCDAGDSAAALGLTANSALVVCSGASGGLYYRGVRLGDGARLRLDTVSPVPNGFDAVNPGDGTRYQIRPNALTIITPDGQTYTESMTEYAG